VTASEFAVWFPAGVGIPDGDITYWYNDTAPACWRNTERTTGVPRRSSVRNAAYTENGI
jgi:hypothetical protein